MPLVFGVPVFMPFLSSFTIYQRLLRLVNNGVAMVTNLLSPWYRGGKQLEAAEALR